MPETQDHIRMKKALKLFKHIKATNNRVYISGPISNIPNNNAPAFTEAEECLKLNDLIPVNPLKIVDLTKFKQPLTQREEWVYCMKADLKELMGCGAVYIMDDWRNSVGASWEFLNAKLLMIPVFDKHFELVDLPINELQELFQKITELIQERDLEVQKIVQ